MHQILQVKLVKTATNWKDSMADWHDYLIQTKCPVNGKIINENISGQIEQCKIAAIHYPDCELCNPD